MRTPSARELRQPRAADARCRQHRNARGSGGAQCRRPSAVAEQRELAEHRAGADLRDDPTVNLDVEYAVDEQEHVRAALALLDERVTRPQAAPAEARAGAERDRVELCVEWIGSAPRGLLERLAVQRAVLRAPVLAEQAAVGAVDRVAREWARVHEPGVCGAVGAQHELERRPGSRGADAEVWLPGDGTRHGEADAPAHRLREADMARVRIRFGADDREFEGGKRDLLCGDVERTSREAAAAVPEADDLAPDDLNPRAELVRLAEPVRSAELFEVAEHLRRRLVVVGDGDAERQARHRVEGAERHPRDRGDRGLDAHQPVAASSVGAGAASATSAMTTSRSWSRISGSTSRPSSSNRDGA